jgi:hypothetical protein
MQTAYDRTFALPSALVLGALCAEHAGDPPAEVLERAGFTRAQVDGYLRRCAARLASSTPEQGRCNAA